MKRSVLNSFSSYFNQLFQTVLEVIEDEPTFLISKKVYCTLITINIFQLSGYIFCNGYTKPYYDAQFITIARVNEVSPGTFLLLMKGNDMLSIVFFFIIEFVIYSYYTYLFVLNHIKNKHQKFYILHKKKFQNINQVLIVFFTLYYWIFLTPFTEISLGMLSCNQNAFLVEFRDLGNCDQKPLFLRVFGIIGVILSVITNLMILFFFRNYEFCENNLLKRKFGLLQIPICLAFFGLQFFYYITQIEPSIKYICAQIMGISMAFDIVLNYPFRDKVISVFYAMCASFFWVSHSMIAFWDNTPDYDGYQLFNTFWILTSLMSYIFISIQQFQYEKLLRFNFNHFEKFYKRVDFYLEQILRFARESIKNEEYKFKVLEIIVYHRDLCLDLYCPCKHKSFKDNANQISQDYVEDLINSLFKESLKKQLISKNKQEREHLFLKYITFLARFRNNPIIAYYHLKQYIQKQKNTSSAYFQVISQVISNSLEHLIITNQESMYFADIHLTKPKSFIQVSSVVKADFLKEIALPILAQFITERIHFWNLTKKGFTNIDEFAEIALNFSSKCKVLKDQLKQIVNDPDFIDLITVNPHAKIIKILSIYKSLVLGEIIKSHELEVNILDLKKRDYQKFYSIINTMNIISGFVQTFTTSITKERGKIINRLTQLHTNLFNYSGKDTDSMKNIQILMPIYISQIHDTLIDNYIHRGHSYSMQEGIQTFGLDKNAFIFPISINLSSFFGIKDDFCMNGTILKLNTEKEYIVINSTGQNLGITYNLFKSLFYLSSENLLKNESELIELHKDFQRVNVFLYMPKLLKIIKQDYFTKQNKENKITINEEDGNQNSTKVTEKNINEFKKSKSKLIGKQQKITIKIPYNIIDINNSYRNEKNGDKQQCLQGMLTKQKNEQNNEEMNQEVLREVLTKFENFYKDNQSEWEVEKCISQLEATVNIYVDKIYYFSNMTNSSQKQIKIIRTYKIEIFEIINKVFDPFEDEEFTFQTDTQVEYDNATSYKSLYTRIETSKQFKKEAKKQESTTEYDDEVEQENNTHQSQEGIFQIIQQNSDSKTQIDYNQSSPQHLYEFGQTDDDSSFPAQNFIPALKYYSENQQHDYIQTNGNSSQIFPSVLLSPREVNESCNNLKGKQNNISIIQLSQQADMDVQPTTTERNQEIKLLDLSYSSFSPKIMINQMESSQLSGNFGKKTDQDNFNQSIVTTQAALNQSKFFKSNQQNKEINNNYSKNQTKKIKRNSSLLSLGNNQQSKSNQKQNMEQALTQQKQNQESSLGGSIFKHLENKQDKNYNKTVTMITQKLYKLMCKKIEEKLINETQSNENAKNQQCMNNNNMFSYQNDNFLYSKQLINSEYGGQSIKKIDMNKTIPSQNLKIDKQSQYNTKQFDYKKEIQIKIDLDNNQPQSVSSINQSMRNYDNSLIQVLANQKTINSSKIINILLGNLSFKIQQFVIITPNHLQSQLFNFQNNKSQQFITTIFFINNIIVFLISFFCIISFIYIFTLNNLSNSFIGEIKNFNNFQLLNVEYTNQTVSQLFLFEIYNKLIETSNDGALLYSFENICLNQQNMYQNYFEENQAFIEDLNDQTQKQNIAIYSNEQYSIPFISSLSFILFLQIVSLKKIFIYSINIQYKNQKICIPQFFSILINQGLFNFKNFKLIKVYRFLMNLKITTLYILFHRKYQFIFKILKIRQQMNFQSQIIDLFQYNIYAIKKACIVNDEYKQNTNGLYYLLDNLQINLNLSSSIVSQQIEKIKTDQQSINNFFYCFTIAIICLFSATTFLSIPILQRINLYKEKILLLISRVNRNECETELNKLKLCLNKITSITEEWINEDFISILAEQAYSIEKAQDKINPVTKKEDKHQSNRQNKITQSGQQNKNNQQQFSSCIINQKLSIWKQILVLFGLSLICSIFFGTVFGICSSKGQNLVPILDIYKESLSSITSLISVISFTEIITNRVQLSQKMNPNIKLFSQIQTLNEIYQQNIDQLELFANDLSNKISDKSLFSDAQNNSIKSVFSNNLCLVFPDDYVCSGEDKSRPTLGIVGQGFINLLTAYKQIYTSYSLLFEDTNPQQQEYYQFQQTKEFEYLILYGFQTPVHSILFISTQLYEILIDIVNSLFAFISLYFVIGGSFMGIIWIFICSKIRKNINSDLSGISFALTCIPFEKLNEEATIFMLKAIKKM